MEITFLLDVDALVRMSPGIRSDEAAILKAFDTHRNRIVGVASKVYSRKRANSCILALKDFFNS